MQGSNGERMDPHTQQKFINNYFNGGNKYGQRAQKEISMESPFPDPLKKEDIENMYQVLKEVCSPSTTRMSPLNKAVVVNGLKNRNFINFDCLSKFFEQYEEKLKNDLKNDEIEQVRKSLSAEKLVYIA